MFRFPATRKRFPLLHSIWACSGAHPDPFPWVLGVKQPEHKSHHLPLFSAKIRSEWSCASILPICLYGMYKDTCTFHIYCTELKRIWRRPSRCTVTGLYNVLYTVNTQQYISTVILCIHSGHFMATCFDRKWPSSGQWRTFSRYNKVSTHWDPILFTVKVKITNDIVTI